MFVSLFVVLYSYRGFKDSLSVSLDKPLSTAIIIFAMSLSKYLVLYGVCGILSILGRIRCWMWNWHT